MTNYAIISGSTRGVSQSIRVARYVSNELAKVDSDSNIEVVDLATENLPMWREEFWEEDITDDNWARVSRLLQSADGLIFVAPEWNGMVPPPLMNVFLLASRGEMSHKPALIVSVSGGSGGCHPVTLLRGFGHKNNQVCYVPDHVIVRGSHGDQLQEDPSSIPYLRDRMHYSLSVFKVYTDSFKQIRCSAPINLEAYPYGM